MAYADTAYVADSLGAIVDLLQGYFLARPGEVPSAISKGALEVILGI